ncbi:PQQ-binding-like beta-propeller repeat protein [Thermopirellula anaerolimosa]
MLRVSTHLVRPNASPVLITAIVVAWVCLVFPVRADDWPQWRGPNRDGTWNETGIVERFSGNSLKIRWRAPISGGYSGPTVADGRVFVTDRVTQPDEKERIHCFHWQDGRVLWTYEYACPYRNMTYRTGPRASVTVHDGLVYALGTMGHLHCLRAEDGSLVWRKAPGEDYQPEVPTWGVAAAPLVEGNLLIVQVGEADGCLQAFDRKTGKLIWKTLEDPASYSAPIVVDQAGKRVVICWTGTRVTGVDAADGRLLWSIPFAQRRWIDAIISPLFHPETNELFVSCFEDGALMMRLDPAQPRAEEVWRRAGPNEVKTDALHILMGSPVRDGDYLYGVDSHGQFRCLDARTGDRLWEDTSLTSQLRWGTLHMVRNGERVWMFNDQGELLITRLSARGVEVISRATLLKPTKGQLGRGDGVTWSHPAFAYRHVFNRNDEELVCADLSAGAQ